MFASALTALLLIQYHTTNGCVILTRMDFIREEIKLHNAVFKNYDPKLPVISTIANSSQAPGANLPQFHVLVTPAFLKLISVEESMQKVNFLFEYRMEWRDERLGWNPSDYCGINRIYVAREDVWLPEVTIVDAHSTQDYREDYKKFVTVNSTGHLGFFVPTVTSTVCPIKIREFPFDSQQCTIKIMTQLFMPNEYSIEAVLSPQLANSTTVESMGNGEWKVLKVTAQTVIVENPDKSLVEMNTYEFYLKRNPSFYIAVVITPSFVINILCVLGLFLRAESSMSKLGMALTNVMSLTFILGILATVLPKTDELPKIGIYVIANLCLIVAALVCILVLPRVRLPQFFRPDNDKNELLEKKTAEDPPVSWILNTTLLIGFELGNLANFLVLVL